MRQTLCDRCGSSQDISEHRVVLTLREPKKPLKVPPEARNTEPDLCKPCFEVWIHTCTTFIQKPPYAKERT